MLSLNYPPPPARSRRSVPLWAVSMLCLLLCAAAPLALAGSLQVSPILLEFGPQQSAQGIWLSNTGEASIRAQVRVREWQQADGSESLEPTQALVASPPIVQIAPGEQQLVRIVLLQRQASDREQSFRLLVDELPAEADGTDSGLQFLLRYSVPVFALPEGTIPQLERSGPRQPTDLSRVMTRVQMHPGSLTLTASNPGKQRLRISQLDYVTADGKSTTLAPGLLGYVLAGQRMQWTLAVPAGLPPGGQLKGIFNDDSHPQILPATAPAP